MTSGSPSRPPLPPAVPTRHRHRRPHRRSARRRRRSRRRDRLGGRLLLGGRRNGLDDPRDRLGSATAAAAPASAAPTADFRRRRRRRAPRRGGGRARRRHRHQQRVGEACPVGLDQRTGDHAEPEHAQDGERGRPWRRQPTRPRALGLLRGRVETGIGIGAGRGRPGRPSPGPAPCSNVAAISAANAGGSSPRRAPQLMQ